MSMLYRKYIPHSIVKNDNYIEWEYVYFEYLLEMFKTFKNRLLKYNKIDWDNPKIFRNFCEMIYSSSSGHISKNLECVSKENEFSYRHYIKQIINE